MLNIIAVLLAVIASGFIVVWVGNRLRIQSTVLLVLLGIAFGRAGVMFPAAVLGAVGIVSLALVSFDLLAHLKFSALDRVSFRALRLARAAFYCA